MTKNNKEGDVFGIECPVCHSTLWVDSRAKKVVKTEKAKKKTGSLDDLLVKEKERKSEFDRKFEATAELEKEKKKKAQEKFMKAFDNMDPEEEPD
jgi:hypothetical protein